MCQSTRSRLNASNRHSVMWRCVSRGVARTRARPWRRSCASRRSSTPRPQAIPKRYYRGPVLVLHIMVGVGHAGHMGSQSYAPRDGSVVTVSEDSTPEDVRACAERAAAIADMVAQTPPHERQRWINAIADAVEAHGDELVELADRETALGVIRLTGELARMADQLRFYARVAAEGSYLGVTIDEATDS